MAAGSIIGRARNCIPPANQQLSPGGIQANLAIFWGRGSGLHWRWRGLKFSRVGHDDAHDIDAADSVLPPDQRSIGSRALPVGSVRA